MDTAHASFLTVMCLPPTFLSEGHLLGYELMTLLDLSVRTHVCGLRHPTADLRQRFFPFFSFMFGCLHVSDYMYLRHPTSDL